MATYKNRQVDIIKEMDNKTVLISHKEPGVSGQEIVPVSDVTITEGELKVIEDARKANQEYSDFRVEGRDDKKPSGMLPSADEVKVQRMAEDNLKRAEEQRKEAEEWQKKNPNLPLSAKQQLDAIKVVPYRDEKDTYKAPVSQKPAQPLHEQLKAKK